MCFNPSPERRVPSPNRYMAFARFCFCKNNKRTMMFLKGTSQSFSALFASAYEPVVPAYVTKRQGESEVDPQSYLGGVTFFGIGLAL